MSQREREIALEIRSLLGGIARMAHRSTEEYLNTRGYGISGLQVGVLYALHHERQTISDLSRKFNLDPSTLVPTIDALERKSLVVRERDPQDRRRVPLSLTEQGVAIVSEISIVHDSDALLGALNTMGSERAGQLLTMMRELAQLMPGGHDWLREMQPRLEAAMRTMVASDETTRTTDKSDSTNI
ncbi:MAG: MarR family transcriptional regulator [Chloroflexota bacterium]|nr:MarR family transcriptional regulator [Chloroflexota bacterium]